MKDLKRLAKYFLVGAGLFAAVIAFVTALAGIVLGIGYLIDHNPTITKFATGTLITLAAIGFLTMYGWLICDS